MAPTIEQTPHTRHSSPQGPNGSRSAGGPRVLDPDRLWEHVDALFRAAWALSGSRQDAEDLVQETFVKVLKRPRMLRDGNELGYLLRALRNTHASRYRTALRRPITRFLLEDDLPAPTEERATAHEIMAAVAGIREPYRDAVIAVDLVGLSYREAAISLRVPLATLTTRLHRGRRLAACELLGQPVAAG